MRTRPKYRVRIYDEAHLIDRGGFKFSWLRLSLCILLLLSLGIGIGIGIVWYSPLKKSLPGYMKTDQRSRTEEAYLKTDSLEMLYSIHQAYLDNLLKILDTERAPDLPDTTQNAWRLEPDSLPAESAIEREFIRRMEKAGYNTHLPEQQNEQQQQSQQ